MIDRRGFIGDQGCDRGGGAERDRERDSFRGLVSRVGCGALAALCGAQSPVLAQASIEFPFEARFETVIENGAIEGQPVRVVRLRSPLAVREALRTLRAEWSAQPGVRTIESAAQGWELLSSWGPEGVRTLQLRAAPGGGSEGVLSVWPAKDAVGLRPGAAPFDLAGLLPSGARLLRRFAALDSGRRSETLVAVLDADPQAVADAIGQRLEALGLRRDQAGDRVGPGGAGSGGAGPGGVSDAASRDAPRPAPGVAPGFSVAAIHRGAGVEVAFTVVARQSRAEVVLHLTGSGK